MYARSGQGGAKGGAANLKITKQSQFFSPNQRSGKLAFDMEPERPRCQDILPRGTGLAGWAGLGITSRALGISKIPQEK
jgi:hypothetical protein